MEVRIPIMSHLSDAQELLERGLTKEAIKHIEFSKLLILYYPNTREMIDEETLNRVWKEIETDKRSEGDEE